MPATEEVTDALDDGMRAARAGLHEARKARTASDLHEVLQHVTNAMSDLHEAEMYAVANWRAWGASWEQIGGFYGVTKQAAQQRFGKFTDA